MSQLPEIDRAILGSGVNLRRASVDADIDVWLLEFRRTRGMRCRALSDRCDIGVQLEGRIFQRTHRSPARVFERKHVHVIGAGETYDVAYDAGDEAARVVWFSVAADRLCGYHEAGRDLDLTARSAEQCAELYDLAHLLFTRGHAAGLEHEVRSTLRRYIERRGELCAELPAVRARHELEQHFDRDLYLRHIAESVGLRPVTLLRAFTRRYGTTPIQYRIKRRLNFADRLLWSEPKRSVADIAERVGFDSLSYFHRQFTAYLGCTPARRRRLLAAR